MRCVTPHLQVQALETRIRIALKEKVCNMPSPKTTRTRCTGCNEWYLTSKNEALKKHHFHDSACAHRWRTGRARSDRGSQAVWKVCEFCGEEFLAGGRAENGKRLPSKHAQFCDKVCAGRAKENKGKECLLLAPDFASWASGFFDGEGSVFMVVEGTRKRPFAEVSIGSTDRNVLCDFVRETGLGGINTRKATNPDQKDLHMWRCFAGAAISFLRQIDSYLIVKRAIVNHVFKCYEEMKSDPPQAYSPAWRAHALRISNELNERGPQGARRRFIARSSAVEQMFRDLIRREPYVCQNTSLARPNAGLGDSRSEKYPQTKPGWRLCPVDGKQIPRQRSLTCSRECALLFRKKTGEPCRVIDPILQPYVAGLIDGEGCISIVRSFATIHARVCFGNTNKRIVDLMKSITGFGKAGDRPPKKEEHSESWHWRCQCDGAQGLIEQISPYLRIKGPQARLALNVQNRLRSLASRRDRRWQVQAIAESHRLNRKGPEQMS